MAKKKGKKKKAEEMPVGKILPEFKEVPKVMPEKIGKKGVYAKVKATEKFVEDTGRAVRRLQSAYPEQMKINKAKVDQIGRDVKAQEKENADAVEKIDTGVKEIQRDMEKKDKEIEAGARKIRKDTKEKAGVIEEAVGRMHTNMERQARENEAAVKKIDTGVKELQAGTAKFIKDFYYG